MTDDPELQLIQKLRNARREIDSELRKVIIGQSDAIELLLLALF